MEDVCCDEELAVDAASGALAELLGLHLVEPSGGGDGGEARFRVPETVRRFAMEILRHTEMEATLLERHAEHFVASAVHAGRELASPRERSMAALIDQDLPNIRAALRHRSTFDRRGAGLAAAAALGPYWLDWGPLREGRDWLDGFLAAPGGTPGLRAVAEGWSVRLAIEQGEVRDAHEQLLHARRVLHSNGSLAEWMRITDHLATALCLQGQYDRAEHYLVEALARCRSADTAWLQAELLLSRAVAVRDRGDTAAAIDLLHRTTRHARRAKHERVVARAIVCRALIDPTTDEADAELESAFRLCREMGDLRGAAMSAAVAAVRAFEERDRPRAARWFLACLDAGVAVGYWPAVAWTLMGVIGLSIRDERLDDAALLHGALRPHLDVIGRQTPPDRMAAYDRLIDTLARRLGDEFEVERDRGEAAGWAAAVDLARRIAADFADAPPGRERPPTIQPELTDRELDVLRELVVGRTNEHIADRLGLSPKTVMHHTGSLYRKLGVRGRAEAVAHALREHLVAS
jgi:DNA-binding CsgD family transcriptional regulator